MTDRVPWSCGVPCKVDANTHGPCPWERAFLPSGRLPRCRPGPLSVGGGAGAAFLVFRLFIWSNDQFTEESQEQGWCTAFARICSVSPRSLDPVLPVSVRVCVGLYVDVGVQVCCMCICRGAGLQVCMHVCGCVYARCVQVWSVCGCAGCACAHIWGTV